MSEYKTIFGKAVKALASDPTDAGAEGQIWYNTTTGSFRTVLATGAWTAGGAVNTARYGTAGAGTQTAALIAGGFPNPVTAATETYDGTSWTEVGDLTTARMYIGGSGTQTAALATGGDQYPAPRYSVLVEEYNGTSWSEQNDLPTTNKNMGTCGTQTATLSFGGSTPAATNVTNLYDGTNWTNTGHNLNTSRFSLRGAGTSTAALANGGSPVLTTTEEYDGSSWTSVTSSPSGFDAHSSAGTQSAAAMFGGFPNPTVTTSHYDGTTWSSAPNLGTGRYYASLGPIGTQSSALFASGNTGTVTPATEEFSLSIFSPIAATWASGGNLNTARNSINNGSTIGTQTAGVAAGGVTVPVARTNNTEEYNGSAWTTVNPMNNTLSSRGTAGTQTAGLASGGLPNPVAVANSEEYNGSTWTNGNDMNNARGYGHVQVGTQDAAMAAGGYNPPVTFVTATEFYDGTSWTNQPATIQPHYAGGSAGSQTSAWYVGAGGVSAPTNKLTYNWDGTSWTASNSYNDTSKVNFFSAGPPTGTTGYIAGGDYDPGASNKTEEYNGTTWSNIPATLTTSRSVGGNCGNLSAGLAVGGNIPPRVATTEEFTGEIQALDYKTITTS